MCIRDRTDSTVLQVTQFDMVINARDLPVPCGAGACPVLGLSLIHISEPTRPY